VTGTALRHTITHFVPLRVAFVLVSFADRPHAAPTFVRALPFCRYQNATNLGRETAPRLRPRLLVQQRNPFESGASLGSPDLILLKGDINITLDSDRTEGRVSRTAAQSSLVEIELCDGGLRVTPSLLCSVPCFACRYHTVALSAVSRPRAAHDPHIGARCDRPGNDVSDDGVPKTGHALACFSAAKRRRFTVRS
jgi:hypothetical protein